jgi:hypothetical protein
MPQSGAGSEVTALYECLQAYACAARQAKGRDLESLFEINASNTRNAKCDRPLKDCMEQFKGDEGYSYSIVETANQFFRDYQIRSGYTFHRGLGKVEGIYREWRKYKAGSGMKQDDKWNPADIWAIKSGYVQKNNCKSLQELNDFMLDQYNDKNLIGISLKKVPRGQVKTKVFNDGGSKITAKFKAVRPMTDVTASKDVYLTVTSGGNDYNIQLRNFSSRPDTSSWQGEIKGKSAAGGKIGGGVLIEQVQSAGIALNKPSQFNPKIKPTDAVLRKFAQMYKVLAPQSRESQKEVMMKTKGLAAADPTWWMSKYLSVYFAHAVLSSPKKNKVASKIYSYASSATDNSSVFVKYSD